MAVAVCFSEQLDPARALADVTAAFVVDGWQVARVIESRDVTRDMLREEEHRLFDLAVQKGLYCEVGMVPRHTAGTRRDPLRSSFEAFCAALNKSDEAVVLWSETEGRPVTLVIEDQDALPVFDQARDATLWAPTWRSDCRPRRVPLAALDRWLHDVAYADELVALCLDAGLVTFHPAAMHAQIVQPHWRAWGLTDGSWGELG